MYIFPEEWEQAYERRKHAEVARAFCALAKQDVITHDDLFFAYEDRFAIVALQLCDDETAAIITAALKQHHMYDEECKMYADHIRDYGPLFVIV